MGYRKKDNDTFEDLVRDMFRNATNGLAQETGAIMRRNESDHGLSYYNRAADLLGKDRPGTPYESAADVLRSIIAYVGQDYIHADILPGIRDRISRALEREGKL